MSMLKEKIQHFLEEKTQDLSWGNLRCQLKQAFFQLFGLKKGLFFTRSDFLFCLVYLFFLNEFIYFLISANSSSPFAENISAVFNLVLFYLFVRVLWKRMTAIRLSHWWLMAPLINLSVFFTSIACLFYWVIDPVLKESDPSTLSREEFFQLCISAMEKLPNWEIFLINALYIMNSSAFLFILFAGMYYFLKKDKDIVILKKENKRELVIVKDAEIEDAKAMEIEIEQIKKGKNK